MYLSEQLYRTIELFIDHIAFDMKLWDIEDPITGKREIYIEDKNIPRKTYKLKSIYYKQSVQQPNSYNWNFGSIPSHLLKKG